MTTKQKPSKQEILNELAHCYCHEGPYFTNSILGYNYTSGVKTMWELCNAYWLLIAIGSYRRTEPFQVWELKVDGSKAVLTMKEDSGQPIKVRQEIPYTDFPLDEMILWMIDGVLILPSEY